MFCNLYKKKSKKVKTDALDLWSQNDDEANEIGNQFEKFLHPKHAWRIWQAEQGEKQLKFNYLIQLGVRKKGREIEESCVWGKVVETDEICQKLYQKY